MKDLKEYIRENKNAFDDMEPAMGHFERFEALLDKQEEKIVSKRGSRKAKLICLLSIAASIVILALVTIKFYTPQQIQTEEAKKEISTPNEFYTTNEYYKQQMKEQIANVMCKLANTDPENQAQLTADLQKLIENNNQFVNEIAKSKNQELAIHYLIKHYKTNIQALENINEKLGKYTKC